MPSKYGGVAVDEEPKSKYGGVAVLDEAPATAAPSSPTSSGPSQSELDKFMKDRYSGPNAVRNRRQKNEDAGLTPLQVWKRSQAVTGAIQAMPGAVDTSQGVEELMTPGKRKEGLHHVITGAGKAAAVPFLAPALAAAPVATMYGLAAGTAGSYAGTGVAKMAGANDDTADLVGDATGLVAGGLAGGPGRVGEATRGAVTEGIKHAPVVGWADRNQKGIGNAVKAAWEGGKAAWEASKPKSPPTTGNAPQPTTAAASAPTAANSGPVPAPLPVNRQIAAGKAPIAMPPAQLRDDPSGVIKGWSPTILENTKPIPAPVAAEPNKADLDSIVKNLGGKDFASASPSIQKLAMDAVAAKAKATPESPVARYTPPPETPAASPAKSPAGKPKTVREILDAELQSNREAAPAAAPAPVDQSHVARRAAGELIKRGVGVDDLLGMTEAQRTEALGGDAHQFPEIVREMRSQISGGKMDTARGSKDEALARFFKAKGITPEQVAAMDDGTLATHIKSAGYKAPGKSGALGRSSAQIKHDVVGLMQNGAPIPAPNSPAKPAAAAAPVSQPSSAVPPAANGGVTGVVRTPAGTKANVRYKISEASDLKTSFDPEYNKEIGHQPRDTTRQGSRQRVEQRKADMDPNAMGHSFMAGDGAPITLEGNAVTRNHGLQALKEVYGMKGSKAGEYRNWVQEQAGMAGMSPEDVAKMKQPVLHRELQEPDWDHAKVKQFANDANRSSTARMSDAEVARQMSKTLQGPAMGRFRVNADGVPDAEFVRNMVKDLPVEEQGEFQNKEGGISQKGVRMVRNAVFERAYTSTGALETMSESTNPQVKNIANAMLNAAPDMATLNDAVESGNAHDLRIGNQVGKAMEIIESLRQQKKSVPDWLKQGDMMGKDPAVHMLVDFLARESRRPTVIRDMLKNYAADVSALGKPNQGDLFGAALPSRQELLEGAYNRALESRKTDQPEPSLFGGEEKEDVQP